MVYKILSYLLLYPNTTYKEDIAEILIEIKSVILAENVKSNIISFINVMKDRDIYEIQSDYVKYFDTNPSLSLYLFDHIIGDSKDKGQALIDLKETYHKYNFDIISSNLPDYLPLFLEFLSQIPQSEAITFLEEIYDLINVMCLRHIKIQSPYAVIFESIILSINKIITQQDVTVLSEQDMDEMWKDQEVNFATTKCD